LLNPIRIADVRYPLTVLGPGTRLGVWVQGCTIGCAGCMSRHTWDPGAVARRAVADVVDEAVAMADGVVDGITISGGEPFEQAEAVVHLLDGLLDVLRRRPGGEHTDVLCYSGLTETAARRRSPELVARVDALICGPFQADRPTSMPWVGSANQRVVTCSDLGRRRYGGHGPSSHGEEWAVQIEMGPRGLTVIGIPRHGDLSRVEESLAAAGVNVEAASWRL
jgi:anaerobic ribonucleoside-triphosphate reductase activating protein